MNFYKGKLITDDDKTLKYYLTHRYNDKEILIETDELIKKNYTKINIHTGYDLEKGHGRTYFRIKRIYQFDNKIYKVVNNCEGYLYLIELGNELKEYKHHGKQEKSSIKIIIQEGLCYED